MFRHAFRSFVTKSRKDYTYAKVAIVGLPNTGKSTLFNRLVGRKVALTAPIAGLTRDRLLEKASLFDMDFTLIDTPGIEDDQDALSHQISSQMKFQTSLALQSADVVIFLLDGAKGVTLGDEGIASWIRLHRRLDADIGTRNIILVANKCEVERKHIGIDTDVFHLGFGEPVLISAEHGRNIETLYSRLNQILPTVKKREEEDTDSDLPRFSIVGRPNTGKSSLLNTMLHHYGKEDQPRSLVHETAGSTRDVVNSILKFQGRMLQFSDTAGLHHANLRRNDINQEDINMMSTSRSIKSIQFADVIVLTIDIMQCAKFGNDGSFESMHIPKLEKSIANFTFDHGRALLTVLTKWDLVPRSQRARTLEEFTSAWTMNNDSLYMSTICTISTDSNSMAGTVLKNALDLHAVWSKRMTTGLLNQWLQETKRYLPNVAPTQPRQGRKRKRAPKIKYITQVKTGPPTFAVFGSNLPSSASKSIFMRSISKKLRNEFQLFGVPLRLLMRNPSGRK